MMMTTRTLYLLPLLLLISGAQAQFNEIEDEDEDEDENENEIENANANANDQSAARQWFQKRLLSATDGVAVSPLADWSCLRLSATNRAACEDATEGDDGCMWCPFGSEVGACVSYGQGDAINGMKFPHLECGVEEELVATHDMAYWDEQMACSVFAETEINCLNQPSDCTWCVVNDPPFAMCMGQNLMESLETAQPADEAIRIGEVIKCSSTSRGEEIEDIHGLMDLSCLVAGKISGGEEAACVSAADAVGRSCVSVETPLTGALCLSETQEDIFDWTLDLLMEMGVTLDGLPVVEDGDDTEGTENEAEQELEQEEEEGEEGEDGSRL